MMKFYRVRLRSGAPGGIGCLCDTCGFSVPHSLAPGMTVKHCNRTDTVPELEKIRDEKGIGPAAAFPPCILVGDWSTETS